MHLHLQLLCIHTHEIHNYCVFTLMKIMMSSIFFFVTTWSYLVDWSACCRIRESIMRASLSLLFFFLFLALRTVTKACLKGTVSVLFPDTNDHLLWARGDDVGVYPRKTLFTFSSSWCWTPGLEGLMWGFCGRNCFIVILQFVLSPTQSMRFDCIMDLPHPSYLVGVLSLWL